MLYFLILVEGFVSLSLQMLFIRQLTAEVGASAVTSSWIIGFFLLALSIGYKRGGEKSLSPITTLAKNFIKVGFLGGVAVSSIAIMIYFEISSGFGVISSLILYSILVVSPIAYWMGQSLPLLIQESKWGDNNSEISGNALFLSTIGSFLGAVITTNVLLFTIGATYSLVLICFSSLIIGFYFVGNINWKIVSIFASLTALLLNVGGSFLLELKSTPYADVYLRESDDGATQLIANHSVMSKLKYGENDSWYISEFHKYAQQDNPKGEEFLILGAGGFTVHLSDPNNYYTYVDIDPALKEISEKEFIKKKITANFVTSDARRYLIDTKKTYDLIFLDAFSSKSSIPSHLVTKEFFLLLRRKLKTGGRLLVNVIINPEYKSLYSQRFHTTLISTFPFCVSSSNTKNKEDLANVIYSCDKKTKILEVYTDDNNKNEFDFWNMR